ncbi:nucleotidyltransferase family protein [Candidatus Kaiserbacteria bacterium]|nr:nucleotidyltransferase family protein [Candidatus Kaiserbacteria bacterium]
MNLSEIQEKTSPILRSYHVRKASVFGSIARGEDSKDSDVDLLVEFGEPMGMIGYLRFIAQLEESLQKKVDVVTEKSINKFIRPYIVPDLKVIYEVR